MKATSMRTVGDLAIPNLGNEGMTKKLLNAGFIYAVELLSPGVYPVDPLLSRFVLRRGDKAGCFGDRGITKKRPTIPQNTPLCLHFP